MRVILLKSFTNTGQYNNSAYGISLGSFRSLGVIEHVCDDDDDDRCGAVFHGYRGGGRNYRVLPDMTVELLIKRSYL